MSVVQQVRRPAREETIQAGPVSCLDCIDALAVQERCHRRRITQQAHVALRLPCLAVVEQQLPCDGKTGRQRLQMRTIRNRDAYTLAKFAGISTGVGRKSGCGKRDAVELQCVQAGSKRGTVDPRCAEQFEWRVGTAPD